MGAFVAVYTAALLLSPINASVAAGGATDVALEVARGGAQTVAAALQTYHRPGHTRFRPQTPDLCPCFFEPMIGRMGELLLASLPALGVCRRLQPGERKVQRQAARGARESSTRLLADFSLHTLMGLLERCDTRR